VSKCQTWVRSKSHSIEPFVHLDNRLHRGLCPFDPGLRLKSGHTGSGNTKGNRLVELERKIGDLSARVGDHNVVVFGLSLDDGTESDDPIDVLPLEETLDGQGHIKDTRDLDDLLDLDVEELCVGLGPLEHHHGDIVIEF